MANEKLGDDLKEKKRVAEGMELVSTKILDTFSKPEKQPTFRDAITCLSSKWRLRNKCRNSILMTRYYPDLGSIVSLV